MKHKYYTYYLNDKFELIINMRQQDTPYSTWNMNIPMIQEMKCNQQPTTRKIYHWRTHKSYYLKFTTKLNKKTLMARQADVGILYLLEKGGWCYCLVNQQRTKQHYHSSMKWSYIKFVLNINTRHKIHHT